MKAVMTIVGSFLMVMGLIAMGGSAGDCDGHCMPGNTLSEMIVIAFIGMCMFGTGAFILVKNNG